MCWQSSTIGATAADNAPQTRRRVLAAGLAFNSGTDTSLQHDALASMDREAEYDQREARAARNALLAMHEPRTHDKTLVPTGPIRQCRICVRLLRQRLLGWVFAYTVVMTVLNHVPYEFYQPYIDLVLDQVGGAAEQSPAVSGLHMGAVMVLASFIACASIRVRNRLGLIPTLLLAAALQTCVFVSMGLLLHPVVLLAVLLRSIPRALSTAPINAAIAPLVAKEQRATYFSIQVWQVAWLSPASW